VRHVRPQPPVVIPRRLVEVTETSRFVTGYIYSRSRKDPESPYTVSFDKQTLAATCSCEWGRHQRQIKLGQPVLCHHLRKLAAYQLRKMTRSTKVQLRVVSA
jgi:hypothetical protein